MQDDFYQAMKEKGYLDLERGERGSSEEHLTVTQFKVEQEKQRLDKLQNQVVSSEKKLKQIESTTKIKNHILARYDEIDRMGKETIAGNVQFSKSEANELKTLAKQSIEQKEVITNLKNKLEKAKKDINIWKQRYEQLLEQTSDFIEAIKHAPELVKAFIDKVIHTKNEVSKGQQSKKHEQSL